MKFICVTTYYKIDAEVLRTVYMLSDYHTIISDHTIFYDHTIIYDHTEAIIASVAYLDKGLLWVL